MIRKKELLARIEKLEKEKTKQLDERLFEVEKEQAKIREQFDEILKLLTPIIVKAEKERIQKDIADWFNNIKEFEVKNNKIQKKSNKKTTNATETKKNK
jgi:16S rRNA G1207 methylase RsmC